MFNGKSMFNDPFYNKIITKRNNDLFDSDGKYSICILERMQMS